MESYEIRQAYAWCSFPSYISTEYLKDFALAAILRGHLCTSKLADIDRYGNTIVFSCQQGPQNSLDKGQWLLSKLSVQAWAQIMDDVKLQFTFSHLVLEKQMH